MEAERNRKYDMLRVKLHALTRFFAAWAATFLTMLNYTNRRSRWVD